MERPDWAPEGIDIGRPSAARIYDYWLGGSHNFAVDRQAARTVTAMVPDTARIMQANRAFLHRAVRYLINQGVRQFLDLGSGIPTLGNVHEVAQKAAPESRVAYVDIDPVAVAHSRHILTGNENAVVVQADLRQPEAVLTNPQIRELLDFNRPLAVLMMAVLHFVADEDDPRGIVRTYRDAVPSGSYLVISHGTNDHLSREAVKQAEDTFRLTSTPFYNRSRSAVAGFLDGLELVDPGVVWSVQWRPEHPDEVGDRPERAAAFVGVGRKP